jgi:hypothetical protein
VYLQPRAGQGLQHIQCPENAGDQVIEVMVGLEYSMTSSELCFLKIPLSKEEDCPKGQEVYSRGPLLGCGSEGDKQEKMVWDHEFEVEGTNPVVWDHCRTYRTGWWL